MSRPPRKDRHAPVEGVECAWCFKNLGSRKCQLPTPTRSCTCPQTCDVHRAFVPQAHEPACSCPAGAMRCAERELFGVTAL
jgi:hypothetical protein